MEGWLNGYTEYQGRLNKEPNKNESEFINYLNIHKINYLYQYTNKNKHPDFDKLFKINPVTNVDYVSPYHKWDFKLVIEGKEILVDIDGSIHFNKSYFVVHPYTGIRYNIYDYTKFKDSQRPYQTDGLDAYVVQCPDDKLTGETIVVNVSTGKKYSFTGFIYLLASYKLHDSDIKEVLKDYNG